MVIQSTVVYACVLVEMQRTVCYDNFTIQTTRRKEVIYKMLVWIAPFVTTNQVNRVRIEKVHNHSIATLVSLL